MHQQRTASLSFKQGIGILLIGTSFMFLLSTIVTTIHVIFMGIYQLQKDDNKIPYILGSTVGILIVLGIAVGFFITGIGLLRDKKGLYIRFLKN